MTNRIVNTSPYLDNQREFPGDDAETLSKEVDRAYIETALAVNDRTIGIYPQGRPSITGNAWYPTSIKLQSLRQIYPFTSFASIPHGISEKDVIYFGNCYGSYTDNTNWYGIPFATNVAVAGIMTFYITATDIVFVSGAGAPAIGSGKGLIVLEWLSRT